MSFLAKLEFTHFCYKKDSSLWVWEDKNLYPYNGEPIKLMDHTVDGIIVVDDSGQAWYMG